MDPGAEPAHPDDVLICSPTGAVSDPGSLRVLAARGNKHQAIIMTEHTAGGQPLPSARTFELDDTGKIKAERVVFFGLAV